MIQPKKVKLAFFSYGILQQGGGFENYIIKTASDLHNYKNVFKTVVITSTPKATERLQKLLTIYFVKRHSTNGIYRESLEEITEKLKPSEYFYFEGLKHLIYMLNQYDYVYVKNEILELTIIKIIYKKLNCKIIIGVHTPIYYPFTPSISARLHNLLYTKKLYRWLLKDAHQIKVNTMLDKVYMEKQFLLNNINIIHHAFEVKKGYQISNRSNILRVLFVGRLTEAKGIDIFIKIIERLDKYGNMNNFDFHVAGSGEPSIEKSLKVIAKKFSNITLLGHIPNDLVSKEYDWCDVAIIPSKYETLNKVAVEAAIAGKIAISADIPGPREVINHDRTGYLINLDAVDFTNMLLKLSIQKKNDYKEMLKMGINAQNKILREFQASEVYNQFYNQLLNN